MKGSSIKKILVIFLIFSCLKAYPEEITSGNDLSGPGNTRSYPNPIMSGLCSLLFPGGGYLYNGDTASFAISAPLIIPMTSYYYVVTGTYRDKSVKANTYLVSRDIYFYTVFDSYQQACNMNPEYDPVLCIEHSDVFEIYTAPFRPSNYRLPSLILLLPAYTLAHDLNRQGVSSSLTKKRLAYALPLIIAESVCIGVGEESFSRGFVYSASAQVTDSKLAGNLIQSADFGLRHTNFMASRGYNAFPYGFGTMAFYTRRIKSSNEYVADDSKSEQATDKQYFLSTFLFGLYLGWVTGSREDGMLTAIAIHSMWDMLLITRDLLVYGTTGKMYLEISVPYRF